MRILCVFEMGSPAESLDQLRQCVSAIKAKRPVEEVILATKADLEGEDVSWANRVFSTPSFKVKTSHDSHGFWRFLHTTGWTDLNLRRSNYEVWGYLFRAAAPDYILCAGAPSALLAASLLGYKVAQVGSGAYIPYDSSWPSDCPFPELKAWLEGMTQMPVQKLLARPAIVFCPKAADEPRTGIMTFNVADKINGSSCCYAQVLALWDIRHERTADLIEHASNLWGDGFKLMSPDEFRHCRFSHASLKENSPLIIGNYDAFSLSLAVEHELPYIGSPLSRYQFSVASRCESQLMTYRLDDHLQLLSAYDMEPYALQSHAKGRPYVKNAFSNLEGIFSLLIPETAIANP